MSKRPGHRRLGLHRLARGRQARRRRVRAAHLRPPGIAAPRAGHGRHGDRRPLRSRDPQRRRWRTARRSSISPPTRTSASSPMSRSNAEECNARGTLAVLEAARATGTRVDLRQHDLGLRRLRRRPDRRGRAARPARPPLHREQAGRRDVLHLLRRALRRALHDPALRHPLRPARPAGRGDPDLRLEGAQGRAADDRRRWPADQALRLRRGPGRGSCRGTRARRGGPRLQPRR